MYIVMGATGHVGGAVARGLLAANREVTVLTRDGDRAASLRAQGAHVVEVDVRDVEGLRRALRQGRRAFLLNPPAAPSTDTDAEERASVRAILSALEGSGLERVVAESTYGAQPGERLGDLSVLYELEQGLRAQSIPSIIMRGAYYFTNFDGLLAPAREGVLPTMMPADLRLPMVAPADIGAVGAKLLQGERVAREPVFVEGPARHSHADVARAFARALNRDVQAQETPRDEWEASFRELGFSREAANAYARMIAVSVDGGFAMPEDPVRGSTTLQSYVDALVR